MHERHVILIATMREKVLFIPLATALGLIVFDRVATVTYVRAASKTLKIYTFRTMLDVPPAGGQAGEALERVDGSVTGFSCSGSGTQSKCYVLISEE